MTANFITITIPLLSFLVIGGLGRHRILDGVLCVVIVGIFALDALDGYLARKRNATSKIGELLDTLADRMIENTFWIYFCATGQLPVWMPIAVMARGFLTDALQRMHGYPRKGWTHVLTRSRVSRAISGISKMLAFVSLAGAMVFKGVGVLEQISVVLATVAVGVCLLRGLPFFLLGYPRPQEN